MFHINAIMNLSFYDLQDSNFEFANKLCSYTEKNIVARNEEEDEIIYRIKFNHCIALKRLGKKNELNQKLSKIKSNSLTPILKMAHLTLSDKHNEAIEMIDKAKITDELTIEKYNDWPIFQDLRMDEELNTKALEKFA